MKRVAIAIKRKSSETVRLADELTVWLQRRGTEVALEKSIIRARNLEGVVPFDAETPLDLVVVLGGDGTLLSVARTMPGKAPILGVNLGTLGFLTEIGRSELYPSLLRVFEGDFTTVERRLLRVQLQRASGSSQEFQVLNDVVVNKSALARMIQMDVQVDNRHIARYRADGLIVSTPTGSTAYNLSAGGPILNPSLPVAVLAPICPHTLSMRPLVIPDSSELVITLETPEEEVFLTLDGQEGTTLGHLDQVRVTVSETPVELIKVTDRTFYDALREKLGWGE